MNFRRCAAAALFSLLTGHLLAQAPATPVAANQAANLAENLLQNPNFEKGTENWAPNISVASPKIAKDDTQMHDGHPSVRIDLAEMGDVTLEQTVKVKPETRYRLSGWIKTENIVKPEGPKQREGEGGACLSLAGSFYRTEFVAGTKDWTFVSQNIPSGKTDSIKVGPRLGHFGKLVTGTAWFAELSLVELGPAPAKPAATPPPPAQPAAASVASAGPLTPAEAVKANRNNLVFVQGTNGAGSGFIAKLAGMNFLFTNAHVAAGVRGAGFKTLDGTQVQIGAASIAVGHDIFRLLVAQGGKPLEIMEHVEENASIDDDVVVLGNAEGGGVINTIKGKIVGIGPDLVEVDAPFVPGNSGSPIIHLKTGKVIGVATYLIIKDYDPSTHQAIRQPRIRRFGYRVDSVKTWQPVNWAAFFAQANELEGIEKMTEDLARVLMDLAKHHEITPNLHTNPAIKTQIDWWTATTHQARTNPREVARADQNFIAGLKNLSQSDILAARQHISYDYFVQGLNEQQQHRKEISDVFDQILAEMRKMQ